MRVPENWEDAVDVPESARVRSFRDFFNDSALDVLYDRGGGARTIGTFLFLTDFVSSKLKYPKIRAAKAIDAPARQGKRYLTVRRRT
jgi:hypothetical protein